MMVATLSVKGLMFSDLTGVKFAFAVLTPITERLICKKGDDVDFATLKYLSDVGYETITIYKD